MSGLLGRRQAVFGLAAALAAFPVDAAGDLRERRPPRGPDLVGLLLAATPAMPDRRFRQAVVVMLTHHADGAAGLVINRPLGTGSLAELTRRLGLDPGDADRQVLIRSGGPVDPGAGFILHSPDYRHATTAMVNEWLALTRTGDVLQASLKGRGPQRLLVAFGYTGWSGEQFEREMAAGHWLAVPADRDLVFDDEMATKWPRAWTRRPKAS